MPEKNKKGSENLKHRERMRQRYQREGSLESFHDHEVLEMLLFQYLPFKNTNKIAHNLLNTFGSLSAVLDASRQQLVQIDGISDVTATNIAILKDVWLRCRKSEMVKRDFSKMSEVVKFASKVFSESRHEQFLCVYLDHATQYLGQRISSSNSTDFVYVSTKDVVADMIANNAAAVLLLHAHVNGVCKPSDEDVSYTEKLFVTLSGLDVVLFDHVILNQAGDFFSFRQNRLLEQIVEKYGRQITNNK